jgi:hypothetical protein
MKTKSSTPGTNGVPIIELIEEMSGEQKSEVIYDFLMALEQHHRRFKHTEDLWGEEHVKSVTNPFYMELTKPLRPNTLF